MNTTRSHSFFQTRCFHDHFFLHFFILVMGSCYRCINANKSRILVIFLFLNKPNVSASPESSSLFTIYRHFVPQTDFYFAFLPNRKVTRPVQPSDPRWARAVRGANTCRCRPLPTRCAAGELPGEPAPNTYVTSEHAVAQLAHALPRS